MAEAVLSQVAVTDFLQPDNSHDQMLPDLAVNVEGSLPNTAGASSHIVEIFEHDDGPISVEPTVELELDPGSGQNPEKSMKWLRKTGIVTTLYATSAMLWRAPGGLFSHQEKVYFIILIIILMIGLIEGSPTVRLMARTNKHATMPSEVAQTEVIQPDNNHDQMIPNDDGG